MKLYEYFQKVTSEEVIEAMDALNAEARFSNKQEYQEHIDKVIQVYKYLKLSSKVEEIKESDLVIDVIMISIDENDTVVFMIISSTPIETIINNYILNPNYTNHDLLEEGQEVVQNLPVTEWLSLRVDNVGLHADPSEEDKEFLDDKGVLAVILMEMVNNKKV